MVQVFDKVQSPLEQLNPYIQEFASQIGEGLNKKRQTVLDQQIFSQLADEHLSPIQKINLASKASPESRKFLQATLPRVLQVQEQGRQSDLQAENIAPGITGKFSATSNIVKNTDTENESIESQPTTEFNIAQVPTERLELLASNKKFGPSAKIELKRREAVEPLENEIIQAYETAQTSKANLDAMENIIERDDVPNPLAVFAGQEIFGIPIGTWAGADAETLDKLASARATQVGKAYGFGNIRAIEFENYLKTIPGLLNSKEGKLSVIRTIRYFDKLAEQRYNNYKKILKENKGIAPISLNRKLSERMEPAYKKLNEYMVYGDELVPIVSPEGEVGRVPRNQLKEALAQGFKEQE